MPGNIDVWESLLWGHSHEGLSSELKQASVGRQIQINNNLHLSQNFYVNNNNNNNFLLCLEVTLIFVYFQILWSIQTLALANNLEAKNALGPLD